MLRLFACLPGSSLPPSLLTPLSHRDAKHRLLTLRKEVSGASLPGPGQRTPVSQACAGPCGAPCGWAAGSSSPKQNTCEGGGVLRTTLGDPGGKDVPKRSAPLGTLPNPGPGVGAARRGQCTGLSPQAGEGLPCGVALPPRMSRDARVSRCGSPFPLQVPGGSSGKPSGAPGPFLLLQAHAPTPPQTPGMFQKH